jgi:hypothetical protein
VQELLQRAVDGDNDHDQDHQKDVIMGMAKHLAN